MDKQQFASLMYFLSAIFLMQMAQIATTPSMRHFAIVTAFINFAIVMFLNCKRK